MPDEPSKTFRNSGAMREQTAVHGVLFPATQWSMVLRAQAEGQEAVRALNELCRRYWYPIYAYLRCRRFEREDAQDITQSFFMKAVTGGLIQNADQERGKLRSFLLAALNRHLADHLRHERAEKRGGRAIVLPLECHTAEDRFANEPVDDRDPEKLFFIAWARELMEQVRRKLRAYYERTKRGELAAVLDPYLGTSDSGTPYGELSQRLGLTEGNLRVQVYRMRRKLAELLRAEVAQTVQTPEELNEEMAWLAGALRGR